MQTRPSNKTVPSADAASGELPFVTVVMPVLNEAAFIRRGLESLFEQDYPADRIEIIVADGISDDGTREIVADVAREHPQVRMIDNPGRIAPTGMNAGVAQARGEIIIRLDGHAEVANDFIRQDVELLAEHPEAWIVGGPIVHAGRNTFAKAAAFAMSSPFGVGLATHRFADFEGYVEGAAFPAVRRWVFDRVGGLDERLARNEDDEWNYRVARAGGKVFISPRVRYTYFVRESVLKLFRQYAQYSFWRIPVIRKHKRPTTLRQVVPPLFFLLMAALLIAGAVLRQPVLALALPAAYVAALLLIGAAMIPRLGLAVASLVPLALGTIHVAYTWGWIRGLLAALLHPSAFDHTAQMSTLTR
jgi:succinoglycan biosynthesis protein ExoA